MKGSDLYVVAFHLCRRWSVKINGEAAPNTYLASLMLAAIIFMNALTIFMLVDLELDFEFSPWIGGAVVIALALSNTWFFSRNKKLQRAEQVELRNFVERYYQLAPAYAALSLLMLAAVGFAKL